MPCSLRGSYPYLPGSNQRPWKWAWGPNHWSEKELPSMHTEPSVKPCIWYTSLLGGTRAPLPLCHGLLSLFNYVQYLVPPNNSLISHPWLIPILKSFQIPAHSNQHNCEALGWKWTRCNPSPEQPGRHTYSNMWSIQFCTVIEVTETHYGDKHEGTMNSSRGKDEGGEGEEREVMEATEVRQMVILLVWNINRNSWGGKKNGKVTYWVDLQVDISQFKLFVSPRPMFHLEISWISCLLRQLLHYWHLESDNSLEDCPVHCRMFAHPWPLFTRSNCFLPTVTTEHVSRYCQISLGMKASGNHLSWEPVF